MTIIKSCRVLGSWTAACAFVLTAVLFMAGCTTPGTGPDTPPVAPEAANDLEPAFKAGDTLTVVLSDLPTTPSTQSFKDRIKDDGTITLLMNQQIPAAGLKRGELEKAIRARYVPKYFMNLTVTIEPSEQLFFVGGEVKAPGRFPYVGKLTVTKAIQSAGDFTDFANKKKVRLTRANGQTDTINCVKALRDPRLDLPMFPGDMVHVPRRL